MTSRQVGAWAAAPGSEADMAVGGVAGAIGIAHVRCVGAVCRSGTDAWLAMFRYGCRPRPGRGDLDGGGFGLV